MRCTARDPLRGHRRRQPARAEQIAEKYKGQACQDYRKVLERKDVDAIVTATPEHWRALICIRACQAGKDLYAEKPVSLTIREGRLMVQAARKYKRVFQVGSQQRSMAINRAACEFIRKGGAGQDHQGRSAATIPAPSIAACRHSRCPKGSIGTCGAARPRWSPIIPSCTSPRGKPGWISFRPYSGGEMTGWGAHGLDQIQWALGMDDNGPVEVWTEGDKFDPPTITVPESSKRANKICTEPKVFFRYANGVTGASSANGAPGFGGIFHGEKGTFTIDRGQVKSDPPELAAEIAKAAGKNDTTCGTGSTASRAGKRPNADVEIGHRSATVCHLGNIARWTGRKLAGTRSRRSSPTIPTPTSISTAPAASPTSCRRPCEEKRSC